MTALVDLYSTDHEALVAWACKTYGLAGEASAQFGNPHRIRREKIGTRLRLYRDQSHCDINGAIDKIYDTEEYRMTMRSYVFAASEENVTRRIIDEIASLYDKPALRILKDSSQADRLRSEEKRLHLHEIMQESHRLMTLCNEVLLWQFVGVDGKKRLRVVTTDMIDAVPHPVDALVPAGFILDMCPTTMLQGDMRNRLPHFELWDDTYRYLINNLGRLVDRHGQPASAPIEHGLGRIPGVLLHRREPTMAILDDSHGSDIVSAHLGVTLLNLMILRLSKAQGENQPVLQGNLANMATGQVMNGERPLVLPPEVVASMLQMKTDPDHYIKVKRDKLSSICRTYGMSYEQYALSESSDSASGKVYQMRREKLTEIRLESRRRAVMNEGEVIELIGFDQEGMRLDYQEQAMPEDAVEEVALLRDKMKMGLDSPISFIMRKDPDLSREGATALLKKNLVDYAALIEWVRALNVPDGADAGNPGATPQQNGANNHPAMESDPTSPDVPLKEQPMHVTG